MTDTTAPLVAMPLQFARSIVERRVEKGQPVFTQALLLETLMLVLDIPNHARLAKRLHLEPPVVSKWRHNRLAITADGYITMHEETDIPIVDLRRMAGDSRPHTRPSAGPDPRIAAGIFKRMS